MSGWCTACGGSCAQPHAKGTKMDANASAMTAAGNLGLFAVVNTDSFKQICDAVKERTGGYLMST